MGTVREGREGLRAAGAASPGTPQAETRARCQETPWGQMGRSDQ